MKKVLMTLFFVGLSSCSRETDLSQTGFDSILRGEAQEIGMDVGNTLADNFTETGTAPQPDGCLNSGPQFDSRLQVGFSWESVGVYKWPGHRASEVSISSISALDAAQLTMSHSSSYIIDDSEPQRVKYSTVSKITEGRVHVSMVSDEDDSDRLSIVGQFNKSKKSHCSFENEKEPQKEIYHGVFVLSGGVKIPSATLTKESIQGLWRCFIAEQNKVVEIKKAKKITQVVSSFNVPGFKAFAKCEAVPLYTYMTIQDENNSVVESRRTEVRSFSGVVFPTPVPNPG